MQAIVLVESPVKAKKLPKNMSDWNLSHLPYGAVDKWRKGFITTFAAYIGTTHSPWDIKDEDSIDVMQDCWNHVYRSTPAASHRISGIRDIVFVLVGTLSNSSLC